MIFYDCLLFLGTLFALPKWLFQKKYRGTLSARLGFSLPKPSSKTPVFWFHMVSMGETKAISSFYQKLHKAYPSAAFYFSSTTKTGHEWAKKLYPDAISHFYLPLDFSWTMKRLVKRVRPRLLFLSESDFWYHLCRSVKLFGGKVLLLNGKVSEKSAKRFRYVPFFANKLFSQIDHFCVQNETEKNHFQSLQIPSSKITVTGNLKLSTPPPIFPEEKLDALRERFHIKHSDFVITLGSTHTGEEALLLSKMPNEAKVLVVPRHPSRFSEVKKYLEEAGHPNWILVDQMGILSQCYAISDLAIVGGSFISGIGGHNIFEPIQVQVPVLFGPYMETQKELVRLVLEAGLGLQVEADALPDSLETALSLKKNVEKMGPIGEQVLEKTWAACKPYLP